MHEKEVLLNSDKSFHQRYSKENSGQLTMTLSPGSETESSNSSSSSPMIISPSPQSKQLSGMVKTVPPLVSEARGREPFSAGSPTTDVTGKGARSLDTSGVKLEEEDERGFSFRLEKSETDFDLQRQLLRTGIVSSMR